MRGDSAIRPSRSSEKSMGSTELKRSRSISVSRSRRRISPARRKVLPGSLPQRPRLMPLSTTSRYRRGEIAHLFHDEIRRRTARPSANERNNAKRTAVIAAVLNFEIGARAIRRRFHHRGGEKIP